MAITFYASMHEERRSGVYQIGRTEAEARALYTTEMKQPPAVVREETSPVVGESFRSPYGDCVCTSYDSRYGFWMEWPNKERHNVSESAIGRTYHRIGQEW